MKNIQLYHGTSEGNYKRILEMESIRWSYNTDNVTQIINELLEKYGDKPNLRDGAIFFFSDKDKAAIYDYILTVDIEKLDISNLYVADMRISTDIYSGYMRGQDNISEIVKSYEDNFISYSDYLKDNKKIEIPEFLYFGEIPTEHVSEVTEVSIDWLIEEYL